MKKFFSLVLALVMALSLATVAWGAVTGAGTDVEPYMVGTKDELVEALGYGGYIKLTDTADISSDAIIEITQPVTIDLNGQTITGTGVKLFRITTGVEVTFKNGTIKNTAAAGRCIETRTSNVTLNLVENVKLETTGSGNTQPLTVGDNGNGIIVNVTDSTIDAGDSGYGIITFNPVELNIENSDITGYAAIYMKAADSSCLGSNGSVVNITSSTLTGIGHEGDTNAFGTIVFEDDGIEVNVYEGSTITATGSQQEIFKTNNKDDDGITISGGTFSSDVNSDVSDYLAEGVVIHPDGTVTEAATFSGTTAITTSFKEDGTYYVLNAGIWDEVTYVPAEDNGDGTGNVAYFEGDLANYVICKKSDDDAMMLTSGMASGDKLLGYVKVAPVEYTLKGTKVAASAVVNCTTDFHAKGYKWVNPITGDPVYFVDGDYAAVDYDALMLVGKEVVAVKVDTTAIIGGHILNLNKTNALDAAKTTYEYKCVRCGAVFKGVESKVAGVEYTTYEWDADLDAAYAAAGYDTSKAVTKTLYLVKTATPSAGTSTDKTVTSAETFDAGIAMYVGMSVMAAAGSAVVLKKRED